MVGYDVTQNRRAILRNFPLVGRFRYLLEGFGPELRQFHRHLEQRRRPFSRDQRRWIKNSSEGQPGVFGFGTDDEVEAVDNLVIIRKGTRLSGCRRPVTNPAPSPTSRFRLRRSSGPRTEKARLSARLGREHLGHGFGALSPPAVEALNRGAAIAGCLQNTGEGGIAPPPQRRGADLQGRHRLFRLAAMSEAASASSDSGNRRRGAGRGVEIKLSPGAKPGLGNLLPAAKVTPEIAACRGVLVGVDCVSPPSHSAFGDVGLIEFVEQVAGATGLPVGIGNPQVRGTRVLGRSLPRA